MARVIDSVKYAALTEASEDQVKEPLVNRNRRARGVSRVEPQTMSHSAKVATANALNSTLMNLGLLFQKMEHPELERMGLGPWMNARVNELETDPTR